MHSYKRTYQRTYTRAYNHAHTHTHTQYTQLYSSSIIGAQCLCTTPAIQHFLTYQFWLVLIHFPFITRAHTPPPNNLHRGIYVTDMGVTTTLITSVDKLSRNS